MSAFAMVTFLSVMNKAVIDAIFTPIKMKFPNLETWWLIYVSWVTGGLLSIACGINLFATVLPSMPITAGLILTAVVVGGGSNLVDDISNMMKSFNK